MLRQPLARSLAAAAGKQHRPALLQLPLQLQQRGYQASAPRRKSPPLPPFSSITHSNPRIDQLLRQYCARFEENHLPPAAPMAGQLTGGEGGNSIFVNNSMNLAKIDIIGMGAYVRACRLTAHHPTAHLTAPARSFKQITTIFMYHIDRPSLYWCLSGSSQIAQTDYDYTLVGYTDAMEAMIYEMARDHLVDAMAYPAEIKQRIYDPSFAIRYGIYSIVWNPDGLGWPGLYHL